MTPKTDSAKAIKAFEHARNAYLIALITHIGIILYWLITAQIASSAGAEIKCLLRVILAMLSVGFAQQAIKGFGKSKAKIIKYKALL